VELRKSYIEGSQSQFLNPFFSPHFRKSIQLSVILRKCGPKLRMPATVHYAPCTRIHRSYALRFHLKPSLWEELNVNYSYILTSPLALGTVNNITSVSHPFQFDIDETLIFFLQIYIECYLVVASWGRDQLTRPGPPVSFFWPGSPGTHFWTWTGIGVDDFLVIGRKFSRQCSSHGHGLITACDF
jgi:hypothetical protein